MSLVTFEANRNKRVVYMAKYFEKPTAETFSQMLDLKYPCNFKRVEQKMQIFIFCFPFCGFYHPPPFMAHQHSTRFLIMYGYKRT